MQIILDMLKKAGGWQPSLYLKIDHEPYMELVIEAMDESGPCGLPALSVCHYGEQNGDAMRDPEMCFELGPAGGAHLNHFYWRNDYVQPKPNEFVMTYSSDAGNEVPCTMQKGTASPTR